jgi:hypothetical protein
MDFKLIENINFNYFDKILIIMEHLILIFRKILSSAISSIIMSVLARFLHM